MREDYADLTEFERWMKSKGIGWTGLEFLQEMEKTGLNVDLICKMRSEYLRTGKCEPPGPYDEMDWHRALGQCEGL